jgi:hypothetical protein
MPGAEKLRLLVDDSVLRDVLESRRDAVAACDHWRASSASEAAQRLAEFELLVSELDAELAELTQASTAASAESTDQSTDT